MKKNILLAIAICLPVQLIICQGTKYINLYDLPPYYLSMDGNYSWMTDFNMVGNNSEGYRFHKMPYYDFGSYPSLLSIRHTDYCMVDFVPDSIVTVIGVAYGSTLVCPYDVYDLHNVYNHFIGEIYVPNGDGFVTHSARMAYDATDTSHIKTMCCHTCNHESDTNKRNYVIEAFFDEPIVLSDTFYAGTVCTNNSMSSSGIPSDFTHDLSECGADIIMYKETHYDASEDPMSPGYYPPYEYPLRHHIYRHYGTWYDTTINIIAMIWPIIQINGDVCDEVANLEATRVSANAMYLTWDAGVNHSKWQVSYGPHGTPPGEGTVIETTIPQAVISCISPDSVYTVAYVRGYCDLARAGWAPWSEAISVGIQDTPQADVPLAVYPNPTKGTFRIEAEATITAVELYDLSGSAVLSLPVNNTGMGIDISALPEGAYILAAHTDNGLATRRIVKQ